VPPPVLAAVGTHDQPQGKPNESHRLPSLEASEIPWTEGLKVLKLFRIAVLTRALSQSESVGRLCTPHSTRAGRFSSGGILSI